MPGFEGYKVPECTEEEVGKTIEGNICALPKCPVPVIIRCGDCVLGIRHMKDKGVTQRYKDHRWPQRIAVHCKTQEEWDRVREKAGHISTFSMSDKEFKDGVCITLHGGWNRTPYLEYAGYKIISAAEFLGEEKGYYYFDRPVTVTHPVTGEVTTLNTEADMNASIKKVYGNTRTSNEVDMVDKFFGEIPVGNFSELLLEKHKDEIFKKAKALQKEEDAAKKD
ncbi:MAG: hypothetical protein KAR40_09770 [Candidatus Sabulitectum sp.]|nr:hypothetical protein [Candidatus Sabulitectum sp.]